VARPFRLSVAGSAIVNDVFLTKIEAIIQEDVGKRGLCTDAASNLITATAGDFAAACRSIAEHRQPVVAVVTGFYIPAANPPVDETDGPLGALFLARALTPLGIHVMLVSDGTCANALRVGLAAAGLTNQVPLIRLPSFKLSQEIGPEKYWQAFQRRAGGLTHLVALERVGPSHTIEQVPPEHRDRCHTMRGRDITANMSPAHWLLEAAPRHNITTIGIGDGGNELGMGKIPWDIIQRNIPGGGLVACRVGADWLIVCGISNWGAYGLAAGVRVLRGAKPDASLFDVAREEVLLRLMVEQGPLVDGVSGLPTVTVDGLAFDRYVQPLRMLAGL
jgi:D-glutamate cyclase